MAFNFQERYDTYDKEVNEPELTIKSLEGDVLKRDLYEWADNLGDLIFGKQQSKLHNHGFTFLVNGAWGAGKTTAVRRLTKHIKEEAKRSNHDIEVLEKSFLPFGNVSESITDFVHQLSDKLLDIKWLNIKQQMDCLIENSTPANERTYNIGISAGLFSFNKNHELKKVTNNEKDLENKFKKLAKKQRTLILVIDDIDRLKPNETIALLRMTEKLRRLPNVVTIIPFHKQVVIKTIKQGLGFERDIEAHTFIKKSIDSEMSINNPLSTLEDVFLQNWDEIDKHKTLKKLLNDPLIQDSDLAENEPVDKISKLCWYMLLHIAIIEEALSLYDKSDNSVLSKIFTNEYSSYLASLRLAMAKSKNNDTDRIYPVEKQDKFVKVGESSEFSSITNTRVDEKTSRQLNNLAKNVQYNEKLIYKSERLLNELKKRNAVDKSDQYNEKTAYIFTDLFAVKIAATNNELLITENIQGYYKIRDIERLSRIIQRNVLQKLKNKDSIWGEDDFNIVKLVFASVREAFDNEYRK